ncbi:DUF5674 family protein [Nostoc sp. 'Peltigera membranacea cyanobiont' 232]|uniref:DUF5674 family protein n=1 Tax=Nostoc sp. 'Peltigera membranacea cyanobiont' 232 TaxID=2014531 RepID=UPI001CB9C0FA|nr:DUF5674 family protein [Nostoc sp. 'Peltigera membranacea cyanobiont' 232]
MVLIIKQRAILEEFHQMLQILELYIKIAVDIERGILAGGGEKHAFCEAALLEDGSRQRDIWGADWTPFNQSIAYESIINIRPSQNNRSMLIQDPAIQGSCHGYTFTTNKRFVFQSGWRKKFSAPI